MSNFYETKNRKQNQDIEGRDIECTRLENREDDDLTRVIRISNHPENS